MFSNGIRFQRSSIIWEKQKKCLFYEVFKNLNDARKNFEKFVNYISIWIPIVKERRHWKLHRIFQEKSILEIFSQWYKVNTEKKRKLKNYTYSMCQKKKLL